MLAAPRLTTMTRSPSKVAVGILGATGAVGQRFVELLADHPWFEIVSLAASERSAGRRYGEAVNWMMGKSLPPSLANLVIEPCDAPLAPKILFSALDNQVAGEIETRFLDAGYTIISNAKNHRMRADVPLLIPEVNSGHLELLKRQSRGQIACVPNCSTVGLVMALKPLQDRFGIEQVHIVTMQAISGAGYPGVASLDIIDNVIPYISGEEEKLETETLKILGTLDKPANFVVSASCNRVAVTDGHTASVSVKFKKKPSPEELLDAWRTFSPLKLPSAPLQPIWVHTEERHPQPKLHRHHDKAMAVHVGRLRPCSLFDYKFTLLSHNTVRGAAGGAVLNAELMASARTPGFEPRVTT